MSYLALARKWRPRTFSQLVGQHHINKALINSLNQQRIHHAYLFTGTRGVGKTSIARLLAKALNCEQGINAEPCLNCDTCIAIEQGRFIDLIEIDGASRTRVEDTRELLDNVQYNPASGRFKIYLIDEVHMLSTHSFNALLKTLEEPPSHVKFLLATTDPQKLPVTVLSRCLQFNLKHLPAELITPHLEHILSEEQIPFELSALELIAKAAKGSMRDALSLLDQAIAISDNHLLADEVKGILGYTQQDYALQLLQALADFNSEQLIQLCRKIAIEGGYFSYVLEELLDYLHQITVNQCLPSDNPLLTPSAALKLLANQLSPEDVQLFYQIALKGTEEMHLAPTIAIGFEMTMLRMLTFRPAPATDVPPLAYQQKASIETLEKPVVLEISTVDFSEKNNANIQLSETAQSSLPSPNLTPFVQERTTTIDDNRPPQKPAAEIEVQGAPERKIGVYTQVHEDLSTETMKQSSSAIEFQKKSTDWGSIISQLKLTGLALNALENAELLTKSAREITLLVAKGHQSLFTPTVTTRIEQALSAYYNESIKIILSSDKPVHSSPAQQKQISQDLLHKNAETNLLNDPFFQQLQQEFSAELVKNSIVPIKDEL